MTKQPKCEFCGRETKELFETKSGKDFGWACEKCKDVRYKSINNQSRKVKGTHKFNPFTK